MSDKKQSDDERKPFLLGPSGGGSKQDEALVKMAVGEYDDEIKPFYDPSSVPGHAEQQLANDMAEGNLPEHVKRSYYRRFGVEPAPHEQDYRWVRDVGPDGKRSYNAEVTKMTYRRQGYRPATADDLRSAEHGIPPTAEVLPDGSVRREDTRLYVIDGERARQLDKEARERAGATSEREAKHPGDVWLAEEERTKEDPFDRLRRQS